MKRTVPGEMLDGRELVVLVGFHPECPECTALRAALRRRAERLADLGASTRDAGGCSAEIAVRAGLPPGQPGLVVADRWGVVYAAVPVHGREPDTLADDVVAWLDFIQMQCPECGVPEW